MWNSIQLTNVEFGDVAVLLNQLKTDRERFNAITQSGENVLILTRPLQEGWHQVLFSPYIYKLLSHLEPAILRFDVSTIWIPIQIGALDGFSFFFGDRHLYQLLKVKTQLVCSNRKVSNL